MPDLEDWEAATWKFWAAVEASLEQLPHTQGRARSFIDAYRHQLKQQKIDLRLIYHRGPERTAEEIAKQSGPLEMSGSSPFNLARFKSKSR